jgi:hypothetical protein
MAAPDTLNMTKHLDETIQWRGRTGHCGGETLYRIRHQRGGFALKFCDGDATPVAIKRHKNILHGLFPDVDEAKVAAGKHYVGVRRDAERRQIMSRLEPGKLIWQDEGLSGLPNILEHNFAALARDGIYSLRVIGAPGRRFSYAGYDIGFLPKGESAHKRIRIGTSPTLEQAQRIVQQHVEVRKVRRVLRK